MQVTLQGVMVVVIVLGVPWGLPCLHTVWRVLSLPVLGGLMCLHAAIPLRET